ncbi:MAG TPA: iron-sulfur cluster assembly accessory protein [Acidobacteriota bacterium]|nr:iron-sulfur cluster assembly accessory protein [Acidobacteriota bacterium]
MTDILIRRDMTIGEIVKQYPAAAEVFMEYGLHCVGCHVSYWETIEQGAASHGMSSEEIDMMVRDANEIVKSAPHVAKDEHPIHLTPNAIAKVKSFMQADEKDAFFRVGITPGGCSGLSYVFSLDKESKADDAVFEKDGLKVIISKAALEKLKDATIDYVETLAESGFKITNPNATKGCGCGSSFS